MKKILLITVLCLATLLCSCKNKDVEVISDKAEMGTTVYTIIGQKCLDGIDYESHDLNVAVRKIEDNTLYTCISTYNPKFNKEEPTLTPYVLAQDAKFFSRDSDIVNYLAGNIENEVVYKALSQKKFMKKFKKAENPKMYLWLNDLGEVEIAMLYHTDATRK